MGIFAKLRARRPQRVVSPFRRTTRWIVFPFLAIVVIILGIKFAQPQSSADAAWYDYQWFYRTPFTIENWSSTISTERKVKFDVDTATLISAGKLQNDCDDIRFTDQSGDELEYFIDTQSEDCNTNSTDLYVKLPKVINGSQQIYMYYGNAEASKGRSNDFFAPQTEGVGLIGYYPMNENSVNSCGDGIADSCDYAGTNNGAWNGDATQTASGRLGRGTTYDGTGDYTSLSPSPLPTSELSLSVWVKVDSHKNYNRFITNQWSGEGDWLLYSNSTDWVWGIRSPGTNQASVTAAHSNTTGWTHLVATYDGTTQRLYVNGSEVGTPLTHSVTLTQNQLRFSSDTSELDGSLDEVRIYQRALSSNDVASIYNAGNPTEIPVPLTFTPDDTATASEEKSPGPIAAWTFDEGFGATAHDSIGDSDATINGAAWKEESECISGKCLYFDGTDDYLSKADTATMSQTGAVTLSAWVKTNSLSQDPYGNNTINTVLSKWDNLNNKRSYILGINYNRDGNIVFGISHNGTNYDAYSTEAVLEANTWYHITATYDGDSTYRVFLNGQEQALPNLVQVGSGTAINDNDARLGIGDTLSWAGQRGYFHGYLDEVRIFSYDRTPSQIKADFNSKGALSGSSTQVGANSDASSTLSNGLVAYYPFNETSSDSCAGGTNDACDVSGNGLDGTWNGDTTSTRGRYGSAAQLDGSGDYVQVADDDQLDITSDWTIAGWFNDTAANLNHAGAYLISKGSVYGQSDVPYYLLIGNNIVRAGVQSSWTDQNVQTDISGYLSVNQWNHFVATFNDESNTLKLYVNGELKNTSTTVTNTPVANTTALALGRRPSGDSYFTGNMDEVRIYNRTLSDAEVSQLHQLAPGPVAHWKLDENTGTAAQDSAGNTHTGTLTNSPSWTTGKYGGAITFNGSNQYVTVADSASLDIPHDITVMGWVKPAAINSTNQMFLGKGIFSANTNRQYALRLNSSNNWQFFAYSGSSAYSVEDATTEPSVDRWDHIAAVREQATGSLKLYVNGKLMNTSTGATGDLNSTSYAFALGREGESGSNMFAGSIDDVRIYNYALSNKQIQNVINARSVNTAAIGSPIGHPLLHLSFEEGYGTTTNDISAQENTGTLSNIANPATSTSGWTTDGKFGTALRFDGSNDYVSVAGSYPGTTTDRTLCAWVKSADSTVQGNADHVVNYGSVTTNQAFGIMSYTGNTWWFYGHGGADINTGVAVDTNWHNHCVTYDGSTVRYYYDARLVATAARTLATATSNFKIGTSPDGAAGNSFNGVVDEVLLFNYALTESEINLQYNNQKTATFGSKSTESDGATASNAGGREYCPPGDNTSCATPIAEWKLDENTGTTIQDTSGQNNTGTFNDSPKWKPGKFGSALKFDGVNDYVDVGPVFFNDANFSVSSWINIQNVGETYTQIIGNWSGLGGATAWALGYNWASSCPVDDRSLYFQLYRAGNRKVFVTPADSFNLNQWHHVTVTRTGDTTARIFIDGVEQSLSTCYNESSLDVVPASQNTYIGARAAGAGRVNGSIDQVRIYEYARTPAQIAWEYNRGAPVAQYKFDECQGTTAYNSALNANGEAAGNDATIVIGASGTNTSAGSCAGSSAEAWAGGASGQHSSSLEFDGTDDYVRAASVPSNQTMTVTAWVKAYSRPTWGSIVKNWPDTTNLNKFHLGLQETSGDLSLYVAENDDTMIGPIREGTAFPLNSWQFVAFVADGSTIKLYRNGTIVGTPTAYDGTLNPGGNTVGIGAKVQSNGTPTSTNQGYWDGLIDDVQIYNHALTDDQILEVYNNGAVSFR